MCRLEGSYYMAHNLLTFLYHLRNKNQTTVMEHFAAATHFRYSAYWGQGNVIVDTLSRAGERKLFVTGQAKLNQSTIQLNAWVADNFTTANISVIT